VFGGGVFRGGATINSRLLCEAGSIWRPEESGCVWPSTLSSTRIVCAGESLASAEAKLPAEDCRKTNKAKEGAARAVHGLVLPCRFESRNFDPGALEVGPEKFTNRLEASSADI